MTRIPTTLIQPTDGPAPLAQTAPGQGSGAQRFAGLLARAGDEPEPDHRALPEQAAVPSAAPEPSMPLALTQNLLLMIGLPAETSGGAGPEPLPLPDPVEPQDKVLARMQPMDAPAAGMTLPVEPASVPAARGSIAQTTMPPGAARPSAAAEPAVPAVPAPAGAQAQGQMPAGTLTPGVVGTIAVPSPAPGSALSRNTAGGGTEADAALLGVSERQEPGTLPNQLAPQLPKAGVTDAPKPTGALAAGPGEQLSQALVDSALPAVALAPAGAMQGTAAPHPADGLPTLEGTSTARPAPAHPPLLKQLTAPLATIIGAAQGQRTMEIRVAPETLGPITVSAQLGAAGLRVDLSAPTDAGTHALRALLPELRRELAVLGQGSVQVLSVPDGTAATGNAGSGAGQGFAGTGQGHFQQQHSENAPTHRHPAPGIPLAEGADSDLATQKPPLPAQPVATLDLLA